MNEKDFEKFLHLFLNIKDKEILTMLFQLFMTANEREMMANRYCIVEALLMTDAPQREIANHLHLSISKITAGSKATQLLSEKHKNYLKKKMK